MYGINVHPVKVLAELKYKLNYDTAGFKYSQLQQMKVGIN